MKRALGPLLFITGIVNALPAIGTLGASQLSGLYGVPIAEPDVLLLLQHRAVLLGLLGGFLMYAAFHPHLRGLALVAGLVSMLSFVALSGLTAPHHALIDRVMLVDLVLSVLLLPAAALMSYHFVLAKSATSRSRFLPLA